MLVQVTTKAPLADMATAAQVCVLAVVELTVNSAASGVPLAS